MGLRWTEFPVTPTVSTIAQGMVFTSDGKWLFLNSMTATSGHVIAINIPTATRAAVLTTYGSGSYHDDRGSIAIDEINGFVYAVSAVGAVVQFSYTVAGSTITLTDVGNLFLPNFGQVAHCVVRASNGDMYVGMGSAGDSTMDGRLAIFTNPTTAGNYTPSAYITVAPASGANYGWVTDVKSDPTTGYIIASSAASGSGVTPRTVIVNPSTRTIVGAVTSENNQVYVDPSLSGRIWLTFGGTYTEPNGGIRSYNIASPASPSLVGEARPADAASVDVEGVARAGSNIVAAKQDGSGVFMVDGSVNVTSHLAYPTAGLNMVHLAVRPGSNDLWGSLTGTSFDALYYLKTAAVPTRQFPRDDDLGLGSPRQRVGAGSSSLQSSIRQGWRGTYS